MSVGTVFASTGGLKITRAIRSFRRSEPDLPIYIVIDVGSKTWNQNKDNPPISWLESQPNVKVRPITNTAHINGTLNAGMKWMQELGYSHTCLFHDDVVFSPLKENIGHVSEWFRRLKEDSELREASGLSFSLFECFNRKEGNVPGQPGEWQRPPHEWDAMDLESEELWKRLLPDGKTATTKGGVEGQIDFPTWFVHYVGTDQIRRTARLGPVGQIVRTDVWEKIGGFDEREGLIYDDHFPLESVRQGFPHVLAVPNVPHLHLHNQSIGYADQAFGVWGNTDAALLQHYGKSVGELRTEMKYQ